LPHRLKTSDFDYALPRASIAQHPAPTRDESRLMILERATGSIRHARFHELPAYLRSGDLLVLNDTRVLPARLYATVSAREVEVLLLREEPAAPGERIWSALARPAKALKLGATLSFTDPAYHGEVRGWGERGVRHVAFTAAGPDAPAFEAWLARVGHVPLPPYIDRPDTPEDRDRYQTIFAREPGSVAAPTAALHFTDRTMGALRERGTEIAFLTLHVGPGTFRPVAVENPGDHALDPEPYCIPAATASALQAARARGGRVIAVGTTCARALESWARDGESTDGTWRDTSLFVVPPFEFRVVDGMVTNFHLPRSSLLMLISALAGRDTVLHAYNVAVGDGYRFYSYGDAMLLI
jgi:S-adenosylmethionine:tRNA ribosyltransferase-isomerase